MTRCHRYTMVFLQAGEGKHLVELGDFEVNHDALAVAV